MPGRAAGRGASVAAMTVAPEALRQAAAAAARDAGLPDADLLGDFLDELAHAVTTGVNVSAAAVRRCRSHGRQGARQGVALRTVLDLHLGAARHAWPALVADTDARAAGGIVLAAVTDAAAAVTEGYRLARRSMVREQDSARREFVDDLLSGRADLGGLLHRASGYGLDLAAPHLVAVVEPTRVVTDASPALGVLERAVHADGTEVLVASKEGRIVVVAAAADRAAASAVVDRLVGALGPAGAGVDLHRRADVGGWRMGVGRPGPRADGVLASYDEAREALDLSARLGSRVSVARAEDLLAYRVLLRDRAAIVDLIRTVLEPLTTARGGAGPLVQTLLAWFESGRNTAETARVLHLSVRAVTYRLERIRELTGADPDDPGDAFALHAAALGARLLGWPDRLLT